MAHTVQNVVKHYVCEMVVTTSSDLDDGRIKSKHCSFTAHQFGIAYYYLLDFKHSMRVV